MSAGTQAQDVFATLQPGDHVEVLHAVKIGMKTWTTTTHGTVVRTSRRRHGLHFQRNPDDRVYSNEIVLQRKDGELTTVTLDEFTELHKI